MGKNKLKKFEEMASFSNVIQVEFDEVFNADHPLKGHWKPNFFRNQNPAVLELGCGRGEYTVGLAREFPGKNFIGVDIKGNRMHKGASQALNERLGNVAFLRTRIEVIGSFFGRDEVDEIWLTFPDPQMKKYRKRLTSTHFLSVYARFLKPGGIVHLKTDSQFMYHYTRELVLHNHLELLADEPDLYSGNVVGEVTRIKTYYEKKWLDHGVTIKYLKFGLEAGENLLQEPEVDIEPDSYRSGRRGVVNK